jgi:hypothetical protein
LNLFELFVKIGVDDQASGNLSKLSSSLGKGLATAAKIGTAAVGAAAAGITALTTAAVKNYAEYEQLVGGAQLMFGNAYDTVAKNAQDAYKTVQMSQNEYLQQVNGFATGLKTALDGNEQAAADLAHRIIQAEADIVAATGNTQENVANAFAGIMKSNFTMLDNLQIGITPTKEGFQEVIDKVNEWNEANGRATEYQMGNLADMQSALVDYIEMQGYAGYASREAANTISGSVASMKSAWANLVTGLADGNADIALLVDNLVTTIVGDGTENNLGVLGNILPAVETALNGAATLIQKLVPQVMKLVPELVTKNLPVLIKSAVSAVKSLVESIKKNKDELIDMVFELVGYISESFLEMLPEIVELGLEILVSLANGIVENLDTILPAVESTILKIVDALTDEENLQSLLNAAISIIESLVMYFLKPEVLDRLIDASVEIVVSIGTFMIDNVDRLYETCVKIIEKLVEYLTDPENLQKLSSAALKILQSLSNAISMNTGELESAAGDLADSVVNKFSGIDLSETGKKVAGSFLGGLWSEITKAMAGGNPVTQFILDSALGDLIGDFVDGSHMNGLSYVPYDGYVAELHKGERVLTASEARGYGGGYGGVSIGNITINIDGANYEDEQALAEAIAAEIQNMTDERVAVYA